MPSLIDSAYVTVESVTTLLRALGNDMLFSAAGEILTDTQNFMFPLLNEALAEVQGELRNHGVDTFTKETILTPILVVAIKDPAVQVIVSDTGYFDGSNNYPSPYVPSDLIEPILLWERQTGSTEDFVPMKQILDGLPSVTQSSRLRIWEWRGDQIVMPGATQSNDLRLRYKGSQANFVTTNDVLYIRDGAAPVAYFMLKLYYATKNPEVATFCETQGQKRLGQIITANARMKQQNPVTRRSYGNPRGGPAFIPPRNP